MKSVGSSWMAIIIQLPTKKENSILASKFISVPKVQFKWKVKN